MGFFSKLKKLSLGGQAAKKITGSQKDYGGFLQGVMDTPKPPTPIPFDPGSRVGSSINGQSGVDQPAMRLGWTNGGYDYANSPFNGQPPTPANPMSFGGGGGQQMGMSGPQQMLPPQGNPGSMPPAGAQTPQMGPPTMHIPENPQMVQARMLRTRGSMA